MEVGTIYKGVRTVFEIEIHGRGGDSVHDEFYATAEDARLASAIEGRDNQPRAATVMEFSDGTLMKFGETVTVRKRPSETEIGEAFDRLPSNTKLLLTTRKS